MSETNIELSVNISFSIPMYERLDVLYIKKETEIGICANRVSRGLPIQKIMIDAMEQQAGRMLTTPFQVKKIDTKLQAKNNTNHSLLFAQLCSLFKNTVSRAIEIPHTAAPLHAQIKA